VRLGAENVILGCRDLQKGERAKLDIEQSTGRKGVVQVWEVDLSSFQSVKAFCFRAQTLDRLDIVLENAALAVPTYDTFEGHERTMTVNVISTFLMAFLLLPKLRESALKFHILPCLTIVSSDGHFQAHFRERSAPNTFDALDDPRSKFQSDIYNVSKLIEILIVRQLATITSGAEGEKRPVVINTLTPGLCRSDLSRHAVFPFSLGVRIGKLTLARTTEMGSRTLFAAVTAGVESHGKYMADCKVSDPSSFIRSDQGFVAQEKVYAELMTILENIEPGITKNI